MSTARTKLPFLLPGQMQKELVHNEALLTIDMLLQPVVTTAGGNDPPSNPSPGEMHIVGPSPTASWGGHPEELAAYTEGGWRYFAPFGGLTVLRHGSGLPITYREGQWIEGRIVSRSLLVDGKQVVGERQAAISAPAGGAVQDFQARQTIESILVALRRHGLVEP